MSTLPRNKSVSHYYYKVENGHFRFDGVSQLEPGTKVVLNLLAKDKKTLDKIIVLNTPQTLGHDGAFEFYKKRINDYIRHEESNNYRDDILDSRYSEIKKKVGSRVEEAFSDKKLSYEIINGIQKQIANDIIAEYKKEFDLTNSEDISDSVKYRVNNLNDECINGLYREAINNEDALNDSDRLIVSYKNEISETLRLALVDENRVLDIMMLWERYLYEEFRSYVLKHKKDIDVYKFQIIIDKLKKKIYYLENQVEIKIRNYIKETSYQYCNDNNCFEISSVSQPELESLYVDRIDELYESIEISRDGMNKAVDKALIEIVDVIKEIKKDDNQVDIYMDMQGGDRTAAYVVSVAMELLKRDDIVIKHRIATDFEIANFSNEIIDVTREYQVSDIISGINAFVLYGRGGDLLKYLENNQYEEDSYEQRLVTIIKNVSDSIEISDPKSFESAINELKKDEGLLNVDNYKDVYFKLIIEDIKREYNSLLSENSSLLNEIEWFVSKGFTSQALTYIEDKFPDYLINTEIDDSSSQGKIIDLEYEIHDGIYSREQVNDNMLKKGPNWETRISNVIMNSIGPQRYSEYRHEVALHIIENIIISYVDKYIDNSFGTIKEHLDKTDGLAIINDKVNTPEEASKEINEDAGFYRYIRLFNGIHRDEDWQKIRYINNWNGERIDDFKRNYQSLAASGKLRIQISKRSLKILLKRMMIKAFALYYEKDKEKRKKMLDLFTGTNGIHQFMRADIEFAGNDSDNLSSAEKFSGYVISLLKFLLKKLNNDEICELSEKIEEIDDDVAFDCYYKYDNEIILSSSLFEIGESGNKLMFNNFTCLDTIYEDEHATVKLNICEGVSKRAVDELISAYKELKDDRNLINHAVSKDDRKSVNELKERVDSFINSVRKLEKREE